MAGSADSPVAEQLGDLFGEPARALVRPHERLRHRRRHPLIEPLGDLVPDRTGVALVDRCLRLALNLAQPVAQVVLHVGDQVGDAVGQGDLPARRAPAELIGARLRLLELGDHARSVFGVHDRVELGAQRDRELLGDRQEVVHGAALVQQLGAPEHLAAQVHDERGEPRLVVERAVLQLGRQQPQVARDREHRHVARLAQVPAVDLLDLTPLRVEVGLGQHGGDVGRDAHRVLEELHFGLGVLLRGIRDQQHGVGRRQRRERRQRIGRVEPADARGVDELESALEDLAGQQHLGRDDPALVAGVAPLRHVVRQLFERHLLALDGVPGFGAASSSRVMIHADGSSP